MGGSEKGRHQRTGRTKRREGGGQEGREGGGLLPMTEGGEHGGQRDQVERGQGEWRRAGGLGTQRSVSLPRDRAHVIGPAWPW